MHIWTLYSNELITLQVTIHVKQFCDMLDGEQLMQRLKETYESTVQ